MSDLSSKRAEVVIGKQPKRAKSGIMTIAAVVIVVVLSGVAGYFIFVKQADETAVCKNGSGIYAQMASAVAATNMSQVEKVSTTILADQNYQKDINCLAGLAAANMMIGASSKAENNLQSVLLINKEDGTLLDGAYSKIGLKTVGDLKRQVEANAEAGKASRETTLFF